MAFDYFLDTHVNQWSIKNAFEKIEQENPRLTSRSLLFKLKKALNSVVKAEDSAKSLAAQELLQDWDNIKIILKEKSDKRKSNSKHKNINKGGIWNNQGTVNVVHSSLPESSISSNFALIPAKRMSEDEKSNDTSNDSWNSVEGIKKKKTMNVYISTIYHKTNFGDDDQNPKWVVDDIDMTTVFRKFRQYSVEGAQMRRELSDCRILSLIYFFNFK
ncbi:unnamed protein product [Rhizopus stolonifer]